ncbi:hypothetical protein ACNOYE_04550 [Nannocystaceae bacterium ST9]
MSTRLCLFGVPATLDEVAIVPAIASWLGGHGLPSRACVLLQAPEQVRERRWFQILVDERWSWTFESAAKHLARHFDELSALLFHDGYGVFKFEHRRRGELVLGLNTVGPLIDLYAGRLSETHPQSGFSPDELRALQAKPADALSERERDAVSNYLDAVRIGIAELFPADEAAFLQVGQARQFIEIVAEGQSIAPRTTSDWRGLSSWPSDWDGSIYS